MDADIVILDKENLEVDTVFAMGKIVRMNGKNTVKGTFE